MAVDHARRLEDFDLGLDLQQPADGTNDGVVSTDPWYPVWCVDWGITSVHLSAVDPVRHAAAAAPVVVDASAGP